MKKLKYIITSVIVISIMFPAVCRSFENEKKESLEPAAHALLGKLFSPVERERVSAALQLADYKSMQVVNGLISAVRNDKSEMVLRYWQMGYMGCGMAVL